MVGVYHWAAGHNASSWKDAELFVPERWLDNENYKNDKRGVLQFFNTGPRNCVGQKYVTSLYVMKISADRNSLANAEMRPILAKLILKLVVSIF